MLELSSKISNLGLLSSDNPLDKIPHFIARVKPINHLDKRRLLRKNVFSISKRCLAAIEAISSLPGIVFHENIGSYQLVQKIPNPKTQFDGITIRCIL